MHEEGKKVMVAAGDTFRAGAIEQLAEWANRLNIPCVKGKKEEILLLLSLSLRTGKSRRL